MRFIVGDIVRIREADWEGETTYLGRIHCVICDRDIDVYWARRIVLHGGDDVLPDSISYNVTRKFEKIGAALRIWRTWKRFRDMRKARFERALKTVQDHCKAWHVSPNNPHHVKRMRVMADAHGMVVKKQKL